MNFIYSSVAFLSFVIVFIILFLFLQNKVQGLFSGHSAGRKDYFHKGILPVSGHHIIF